MTPSAFRCTHVTCFHRKDGTRRFDMAPLEDAIHDHTDLVAKGGKIVSVVQTADEWSGMAKSFMIVAQRPRDEWDA